MTDGIVGILYQMDARTPQAAANEWEWMKQRFKARLLGIEPRRAHMGEKAFDLLVDADEKGMLESCSVRCTPSPLFGEWGVWMTAEVEK